MKGTDLVRSIFRVRHHCHYAKERNLSIYLQFTRLPWSYIFVNMARKGLDRLFNVGLIEQNICRTEPGQDGGICSYPRLDVHSLQITDS